MLCVSLQICVCVCVCVCLSVHKHRPHWLPRGPLDGHKHKDTLINSLNVCEGERRPRVAAHPCVHDGEESHCLWRARGRAHPGSAGVEPVQTVLWPIVLQDNPKSGNQQQHQVVLSTQRRRRWTGNRKRACWASPGGPTMAEQHQLTQEDVRYVHIRLLCGCFLENEIPHETLSKWEAHGYILYAYECFWQILFSGNI